ncbi:TATA box-binding protein-associated factor RNA polymerase I subunit, partial [Euroglyphus maynei]
MENCQKCGSQQFYEEDGFQFCIHCQTQSQGFAKEVAVDEFDGEFQQKEIRINKIVDGEKSSNRKRKSTVDQTGIRSSWNTFEAFNKIYIQFIKDFFHIIDLNGLSLPTEMKERFISIAMQLWFKYMRESEVAFTVNEHHDSRIKLHPLSRYRDNYLLANPSSMITDNEEIILPYVRHKTVHVRKNKPERLSFGTRYKFKMENNQITENLGYFDENNPNKYGDPRFEIQVMKPPNPLRPETKKMNKLLASKIISTTNLVETSDTFVNFINRYLSSGGSSPPRKLENNDETLMIKDEPMINDDDENNEQCIMDEEHFKNMKREQMSNKSKFMDQHVSIDACKIFNTHTTPLGNDLVNKQKILVFLYLTIRLFNFNIYLSDLIRWCAQGSIRYFNLFENFLDKRETIMWLDMYTFMNYRYPNYKKFPAIMRNMIIHCNIDLAIIPKPDLYCLIKRYLHDLNLPNGLLLLIRYRYGRFIEHHAQAPIVDCVGNQAILPSYDIFCIISIILTLRDLFDLTGSNEFYYYSSFNHSKFGDQLFIWNEWLYYSRIRLNLIKAFRLNIRIKNLDVVNLNETLSELYRISEFFRDVKIGRKLIKKQYCWQTRFELQD